MNMRPAKRLRGFTLIELLVVMVIIVGLVGLLLPAVQAAREAMRKASSVNNLKQIALASANFESARSHYPPSWKSPTHVSGDDINGWSCQALLLPYLEQESLHGEIDFSHPYTEAANVLTADGSDEKLSSMRVTTYISPAEPRDEVRFSGGVPAHYPINYAVNLGTWLVFDPATRKGGNGASYPDSKLGAKDFKDGMSFTFSFGEVKAWQPYYRNAGLDHSALDKLPEEADPTASPAVPAGVCNLGGDFKASSGHTEWVDGRAHQAGFTTTYRPNAHVHCSETIDGVVTEVEADWTNWQEGKGLNASSPTLTPTYAAVTARSYFSGGVNMARMDGTVKWVGDDIDINVYRAYSTRAGQEIIKAENQLD